MKRIALVTWNLLPELATEDQRLRTALTSRGHGVSAVAWDANDVEWSDFDAVVVRSTWDYHKRVNEFRSWIERLDGMNVPLWNPPAVLLQNLHKGYLADLAGRGIDVVPTVFVQRGSTSSLAQILDRHHWQDVVIKPAVSATAYKMFRSDRKGEDPFRALVNETDVLVQPFLPEIAADGEWSFMFFAGVFSHAVIKRAKEGEFRVQDDFGGTAEAVRTDVSLIAQAETILATIEGPWLYARVDGIVRDGRFMLMELEMIEPSLFLSTDPGATARFADAIERR